MKYGLPKLAKTGEPVSFKTMASAVYTADGKTAQDHLDYLNNIKANDSENTVSNMKLGILGDGIIVDSGNNSLIQLLRNHFFSCESYSDYGITVAYKEGNNISDRPLCLYYASMNDNLDIILVYATSNDWYYSVPLGAKSDTNNTTYYGALNNLILGLQTKFPERPIFFITPIPSMYINENNRHTEMPNDEGLVLKDYIAVVKEVCEYHTVPVIDLFSNCGMNIVHNENHRNYYTVNGTHLSSAGHMKFYKYIFNELMLKI